MTSPPSGTDSGAVSFGDASGEGTLTDMASSGQLLGTNKLQESINKFSETVSKLAGLYSKVTGPFSSQNKPPGLLGVSQPSSSSGNAGGPAFSGTPFMAAAQASSPGMAQAGPGAANGGGPTFAGQAPPGSASAQLQGQPAASAQGPSFAQPVTPNELAGSPTFSGQSLLGVPVSEQYTSSQSQFTGAPSVPVQGQNGGSPTFGGQQGSAWAQQFLSANTPGTSTSEAAGAWSNNQQSPSSSENVGGPTINGQPAGGGGFSSGPSLPIGGARIPLPAGPVGVGLGAVASSAISAGSSQLPTQLSYSNFQQQQLLALPPSQLGNVTAAGNNVRYAAVGGNGNQNLNTIATSGQDAISGQSTINQIAGSPSYKGMPSGPAALYGASQSAAQAYGYLNPGQGYGQAAGAAANLYSPSFSYNAMMSGYSKTPLGYGGTTRQPQAVQQGIIQSWYGSNKVSQKQLDTTLSARGVGTANLEELGFSGQALTSEENQLRSENALSNAGYSPSQQQALYASATRGTPGSAKMKNARATLQKVTGFGPSEIQKIQDVGAVKSGRSSDLYNSFNSGLSAATSSLVKFNETLTKIIDNPAVNKAVGSSEGFAATMSKVASGGNVLGTLGGLAFLGKGLFGGGGGLLGKLGSKLPGPLGKVFKGLGGKGTAGGSSGEAGAGAGEAGAGAEGAAGAGAEGAAGAAGAGEGAAGIAGTGPIGAGVGAGVIGGLVQNHIINSLTKGHGKGGDILGKLAQLANPTQITHWGSDVGGIFSDIFGGKTGGRHLNGFPGGPHVTGSGGGPLRFTGGDPDAPPGGPESSQYATGGSVYGVPNGGTDKAATSQLATAGGIAPGFGNKDTVDAKLTPGEWVINKKSAGILGDKALSALNQVGIQGKSNELSGASSGSVQMFAKGGKAKKAAPSNLPPADIGTTEFMGGDAQGEKLMEKWFGPVGSAKWETTVPFTKGVQTQVNKRVAGDVEAIGREIQAKDPGYVTSAGGFRTSIGGTTSNLAYSMHQLGLAIDINAASNPYLGSSGTILKHPAVIKAFQNHGWWWGGLWGSGGKDQEHFQVEKARAIVLGSGNVNGVGSTGKTNGSSSTSSSTSFGGSGGGSGMGSGGNDEAENVASALAGGGGAGPYELPTTTTTTKSGNAGSTSGSGGFSGSGGHAVYSYLLNNMFNGNKIAAAGATASIWGESNWNPEAQGTGGRGLIGWTPPSTLPNSAFTGNASKDMASQLKQITVFVDKNGDQNVIQEMLKASTVLQAANLWGKGVERYGINDVHPEGLALAKKIAGLAGGTSSAPAGMKWKGERGPELEYTSGGESVFPSSISRHLAAQAVKGTAEMPWSAISPLSSPAGNSSGSCGTQVKLEFAPGSIVLGGKATNQDAKDLVRMVVNELEREETMETIASGHKYGAVNS